MSSASVPLEASFLQTTFYFVPVGAVDPASGLLQAGSLDTAKQTLLSLITAGVACDHIVHLHSPAARQVALLLLAASTALYLPCSLLVLPDSLPHHNLRAALEYVLLHDAPLPLATEPAVAEAAATSSPAPSIPARRRVCWVADVRVLQELLDLVLALDTSTLDLNAALDERALTYEREDTRQATRHRFARVTAPTLQPDAAVEVALVESSVALIPRASVGVGGGRGGVGADSYPAVAPRQRIFRVLPSRLFPAGQAPRMLLRWVLIARELESSQEPSASPASSSYSSAPTPASPPVYSNRSRDRLRETIAAITRRYGLAQGHPARVALFSASPEGGATAKYVATACGWRLPSRFLHLGIGTRVVATVAALPPGTLVFLLAPGHVCDDVLRTAIGGDAAPALHAAQTTLQERGWVELECHVESSPDYIDLFATPRPEPTLVRDPLVLHRDQLGHPLRGLPTPSDRRDWTRDSLGAAGAGAAPGDDSAQTDADTKAELVQAVLSRNPLLPIHSRAVWHVEIGGEAPGFSSVSSPSASPSRLPPLPALEAFLAGDFDNRTDGQEEEEEEEEEDGGGGSQAVAWPEGSEPTPGEERSVSRAES